MNLRIPAILLILATLMLPCGATVWRLNFQDPCGKEADVEVHLPSKTTLTFQTDSGRMVFSHEGGIVTTDYTARGRGRLLLREEFTDRVELPAYKRIAVKLTDSIAAYHISADADTLPTKIIWSSSNPVIAEVDSAGRIHAFRHGFVEITAMAECYSWAQSKCLVETDVMTALDTVSADGATITRSGAELSIRNLPPGVLMTIYSQSGQKLGAKEADVDGCVLFRGMPEHGILIASTPTSSFRII